MIFIVIFKDKKYKCYAHEKYLFYESYSVFFTFANQTLKI